MNTCRPPRLLETVEGIALSGAFVMSDILGCSAPLRPLINTITSPDATSGANRAERRHPRHVTPSQLCDHLQVAPKTPQNWVARGYIGIYRTDDGTLVYDLDEVEAAIRLYGPTKMRDGRRRYGATVQPVRFVAEVVE